MNNACNAWNVNNNEKFMSLLGKLPVVPSFCVLCCGLCQFIICGSVNMFNILYFTNVLLMRYLLLWGLMLASCPRRTHTPSTLLQKS
jgi:hypothetical protein